MTHIKDRILLYKERGGDGRGTEGTRGEERGQEGTGEDGRGREDGGDTGGDGRGARWDNSEVSSHYCPHLT